MNKENFRKIDEKEHPLHFLFVRKEKFLKNSKSMQEIMLFKEVIPFEKYSKVFYTERLNIDEIRSFLIQNGERISIKREILEKNEEKRKDLNDLEIILGLYETLTLILLEKPSDVTNEILHFVISMMNFSLRFDDYKKVIGFLFVELIFRVSSEESRMFNETIYTDFFTHIKDNNSLTGKDFNVIIKFIKHSDIQCLPMVDNIVDTKYSITVGADYSELIDFISPSLVEMREDAADLFWAVSQSLDKNFLKKTFVDIIDSFFKRILEESHISDALISNEKSNEEFPPICDEEDVKNEMVFNNRENNNFIENGFMPIPQEIYINNDRYIDQVFNKSFIALLDSFSVMIKKAISAKEEVGKSFFEIYCSSMNERKDKQEEFFPIYCSLIYLLHNIDNKAINANVSEMITPEIVFDERKTIFNKNSNKFITKLRVSTINIINMPLSAVLKRFIKSPLIFTEIITRYFVMDPTKDRFNQFLESDNIYHIFAMICMMKQHKEYETCRGILLSILFDILLDQSSFDSVVSMKTPQGKYLILCIMIEFFFDLSLSDIIIDSVCKIMFNCSYNSSRIMAYVFNIVLKRCISNISDDDYFNLGCKLLHIISELMFFNSNFANVISYEKDEKREFLVWKLAKLTEKSNERQIFDDYLNIGLVSSIANKDFKFDSSSDRIITVKAKEFNFKVSDAAIFIKLINASTVTPIPWNESIFARPQHLHFLFNIFGELEDFSIILKMIDEATDITYSNTFALRTGAVDYIFSDYLSQDEDVVKTNDGLYKVIIKDLPAAFSIYAKLYVRCPSASDLSSSINYIIRSHTKKAEYIRKKFLPKILSRSELIPGPFITLNNEPGRKCELPTSYFNKFTVEFWMNLDIEAIRKYNQPVQVFRITDNENRFLSIYVQNPSLNIVFQNQNRKISVILLSGATSLSGWHKYTVCIESGKTCLLYSVRDKELPRKSDFFMPFLTGKRVVLEVGGKFNDSESGNFGLLGELRIFNEIISYEDAVELLYNHELKKSICKFTTKSLPQSDANRLSNILVENDIKTILLANIFLLNEEEQNDMISIYEFISHHSMHTEKDVSDALVIQSSLLLKMKLNRMQFDSFISVMFSTKGQVDEMSWVSFVINPLIWLIDNNNEDFRNHYLRCMNGPIAEYCCEVMPQRSTILGLFCHEMALIFDKELSEEEEEAFNSLSLFLLRISTIKVNENNIVQLLLCLTHVKSDKLKTVYMKALETISEWFNMGTLKEFDQFFYLILTNSTTEIASQMILLTSKMFHNEISEKALAIATIVKERGDFKELCSKIINYQHTTTDILSVVSCILWNQEKIERCIISNIIYVDIINQSDMYLFPLLYVLRSENQQEQIFMFIQFIVPYFIRTNKILIISKILVLLELLVNRETNRKTFELIVGLFMRYGVPACNDTNDLFFLLSTSLFLKLIEDDDSSLISSNNIYKIIIEEKAAGNSIIDKNEDIKSSMFKSIKASNVTELNDLMNYLSSTEPHYNYEIDDLSSIEKNVIIANELQNTVHVDNILKSICREKFDFPEEPTSDEIKKVINYNEDFNETFEHLTSIIELRSSIVKRLRVEIANEIRAMFANKKILDDINYQETMDKQITLVAKTRKIIQNYKGLVEY